MYFNKYLNIILLLELVLNKMNIQLFFDFKKQDGYIEKWKENKYRPKWRNN